MNSVVKRDGSVVKFDITRIENAIFAAAQSVGGDDRTIARTLGQSVFGILRVKYVHSQPTVEEIQDLVEKILIEAGHSQTAKAFILYRAERSRVRARKKQEIIAQVVEHRAKILMPDGSEEDFQVEKMVENIQILAEDLSKVNLSDLINDAISNLYNGITLLEYRRALINASRTRIECHPEYSLLAARLLFEPLYDRVLGKTFKNGKEFKQKYRDHFREYLSIGIEDGFINPRLSEFDLDVIAENINPANDLLFHFRGGQTVYDRYLLRRTDRERQVFELPQYLWMRVAMGLALNEKEADKSAWTIRFYQSMSEMRYIPSTPTLFNAGTCRPQLSSCFLNTAGDSLSEIFKVYSDNAKLSKYAGGLGTDWTNVRSLGSHIKGTNGNSQGIIPFLKIFNDVAIAVNQGGKRKGAMCAYLELWHGDVEEFLEAKKNTGDERRRLHDVHTALWIPDLFMRRVEENGEWTFFSPAETPDLHDLYGQKFEEKYREYESRNLPSAVRVGAVSLWRKILTMLFETGHPWLTFKDPCNIRNPQDHCGVIHNSNLCTEITLNNSADETAVCNLGSINLSKMIESSEINEKHLEETVRTAMRMLDNVIDVNYYPTPETEKANHNHRPVGLGVMGYQDALYKMNIRFASEEHLDFADRIMEYISYYAILGSSELAKERGMYSSYSGSKWERGIFPYDTLALLEKERGKPLHYDKRQLLNWEPVRESVRSHGMRNSNCMAIAPTATISNIIGVHPCVEPAFRNMYVKENTDGSFVVINESMVADLEAIDLWDEAMITNIKLQDGSINQIERIPQELRDKYEEVFQIAPEWLLKAAARRAKWIDQSQSLNVFMATTSGKLLSDTYKLAWDLGLKTTYYLRTQSASQIEKTVARAAVEHVPQDTASIAQPSQQSSDTDEFITSKTRMCAIDEPQCEVCQ